MGARSQHIEPVRSVVDQPALGQLDQLATPRGDRHAPETGQFAGGCERRFAEQEQRVVEFVAERTYWRGSAARWRLVDQRSSRRLERLDAAVGRVQHSAGPRATNLIALQESPQRLARDAKTLGCASVALPPGVCSQVCTDQVDPVVVDHGRTPGSARCWGYGQRANTRRGALTGPTPQEGSRTESAGRVVSAWVGCFPGHRRTACRSCSARWPGDRHRSCRPCRLCRFCRAFSVRWSCLSPRSSEPALRTSRAGFDARSTIDPMSMRSGRQTDDGENAERRHDGDIVDAAPLSLQEPHRPLSCSNDCGDEWPKDPGYRQL